MYVHKNCAYPFYIFLVVLVYIYFSPCIVFYLSFKKKLHFTLCITFYVRSVWYYTDHISHHSVYKLHFNGSTFLVAGLTYIGGKRHLQYYVKRPSTSYYNRLIWQLFHEKYRVWIANVANWVDGATFSIFLNYENIIILRIFSTIAETGALIVVSFTTL